MNMAKFQILQDTLDNEFSIENFRKFTKEFFNEPNMLPIKREDRIWMEYLKHISAFSKIASYTDGQGKRALILAVELKKGN